MKEYTFTLDSQLGEKELSHAPVGWDNADRTLARSKEFEGVFNQFTAGSLRFTDEGYDYLESLYKLEGIKLKCNLYLKRWKPSILDYEIIYSGIINGKVYVESDQSGRSIETKIGESSFTESILSRKDIPINYNDTTGIDGGDLSIIANPYIDCTVKGMEINTNANGDLEEGLIQATTFADYLIASTVIKGNNENVYSPNAISIDDILKTANGGWIYETFGRTSKIKIRVKGSVRTPLDDGEYLHFSKADKLNPDVDSEGNTIEADPDWISGLTVSKQIEIPKKAFGEYDYIDEEFEITMIENQALLMYFATDPVNFSPTQDVLNFTIELELLELPTAKTIKTILPFNLMSRLTESVTGVLDSFESSLIEPGGDYENLTNFNGFLARGFSEENSQYANTLGGLANTFKILFNAGIGIQDNKLSLEPIENFYQSDIIATINEVERGTWKREQSSKMFFNEVESGYKKTEYEESSGLEEYNNKASYATTIDNNKSKLSLIPKDRLDGYGITYAIDIPAETSETTDTKYDNENFMLDSKKVNDYLVQKGRDDFESVTGVDVITTPINLDFHPARLLVRNSDKIATAINMYPDSDVKFVKSDVLTDLETKKSGEDSIKENTNIPFSRLNPPRLSGFSIKFGYGLTPEQMSVIVSKRYGRFEVKNPISGEYHYGWIDIIKEGIKGKGATFELLEEYNGTNDFYESVLVNQDSDFLANQDDDKYKVVN